MTSQQQHMRRVTTHIRRSVLVAAALLMASPVPAAAAPLPIGSDQDVAAPVVTSFTLVPTAVNVTASAATIDATISATDDISGIGQLYMRFRSPSGNQNLTISFPTSGSLGGTFASSAIVETYRESGTWTLDAIVATDQVGNSVSYGVANNLGPASIAITSNGDTVRPTVSAVRLSPNPVDVSSATQSVFAEIDTADLGSGVSQLSVVLRSPSGSQFMRLFASAVDRIAGDESAGTYRAEFNTSGTSLPNGGNLWVLGLPRHAEPGPWTIAFVQVYDRAGNSGVVSGTTADAISDGPLMVVSNPADTTAPTLSSFNFSPASIDVTNAPATLDLSFAVGDDLAGVREAWIEFRSPTNVSLSPAAISRYGGARYPLSSPTFVNGVVTGTMTFPQYDRAGTWIVNQVCVSDWVSHQVCTSGVALTTAGPTSLTVTDATQAPLPQISIPDAQYDEATEAANPAGFTTIRMTLDQPALASTYVRVTAVDESATYGLDYILIGGQTHRRFAPAGARSFPVTLQILDNSVLEGLESFRLELSAPENATIADGVSVVTINDTEDTPPADADLDGVADANDNCVSVSNADQADLDGDGIGDGCDDDTDGDGLSNVLEIWIGCNPLDPDSDGDGVWDLVEILVGTNPLLTDTDDDGEGDGGWLVRIYGGACGCGLGDDGNGNGVWDLVEYHYFGGSYDPGQHGGGGSSLIDVLWGRCGCGPDDTDGDGIPQTVEHLWGGGGLLSYIGRCGCTPWDDVDGGGGLRVEFLNLLGGGLGDDPDGDGIITVIELLLGCNPYDSDSDGDGLSDHDEVFVHGTDVLDPDTDGDGMTDGREIVLGCNPLDSDSDDDGVPDGTDGAPLAHLHECRIAVTGPIPVGAAVTGTIGTSGQVVGARIRWGDGRVSLLAGAGTTSFQYAYDQAGVYLVDCEVTDTIGTETSEPTYVVVYDVSAGFVTGGGWIDSPAGAYVADPGAAGRARFGFVSQYVKGRTAPTGNTQFQFQAGDLNFHSGSYEWLVVSGARAQFKGVGTINGVGSYRFMITVIDSELLGGGQPDMFRIKIWRTDGGIVYDNMIGSADSADPTTAVTSGSIVIHRPKGRA